MIWNVTMMSPMQITDYQSDSFLFNSYSWIVPSVQ
jgi:hypothetical protein